MFERPTARKARRTETRRRPQLEAIEGRLLLSGIVGQHIGMVASAFIQGGHIGSNVAASDVAGIKH